ncbi:ATP-binding protein, partial [Nocardia sp. CWNU-33]|uniref:ATP-binding protein n=1 Tax=Nocardia sp. CWNU-33 TaxID=3392117 RepID=UPI00398F8288
IVSNRSVAGWSQTFTDAGLRAAIIDRLTFGGNIIETGTHSYRPELAAAQVVVSVLSPIRGPRSDGQHAGEPAVVNNGQYSSIHSSSTSADQS